MYEMIKDLCRGKNISVTRLEKELGLSNGSVCKWEKSIPRADTLVKVADYFGVPVGELLKANDSN